MSEAMISSIENAKEIYKNLLDPINKFSKVARHKINIQKSILAMGNLKMKKTIPLTIASKRNKELRNKLNKSSIKRIL